MKSISTSLKNHLSQEVTTIAYCVEIHLNNGSVKRFTTLDKDIIFSGETYLSGTIINFGGISGNISAEDSSQDISFILDSETISEADIIKGLYDDALLQLFLINYEDASQGKLAISTAYISDIINDAGKYSATLKSISSKLDVTRGRSYSGRCSAKFCDAECKLNKNDFTISATITQSIDKRSFLSTSLTQAAGYFNYGVVEFTSGNNAGKKFEVSDFSSSLVTLSLQPKLQMNSGDNFKIIRGCDKAFSTCAATFNNAVNFRGHPHIPGTDAIYKTAAN